MIILTNINEIFTPELLFGFLGFIIPLIIYLFLTKYRGIWASLFFLPVLYFAISFVFTLPQLQAISNNQMVVYALNGFALLMEPFVLLIHGTIMSLLEAVIPSSLPAQIIGILSAQWFPLVLYGILWLLFLLIFKKKRRRKKQRRYEDDF